MKLETAALAGLRFQDGLIPVVAQDETTGRVLMLAWANEEALRLSLETGRMTYWSRSRQELWKKGATSGHTQELVSLHQDCDADAVLAIVRQSGPACHTGAATCWGNAPLAHAVALLDALAAARKEAPAGRYTDSLLADAAFAASKVEEEAQELGRVLRGEPGEDSLVHEAADLLYHLAIAVRAGGASMDDVLAELARRQ